MVVHDLNVTRAPGYPAEAHAELIVHTDTELPGSVTLERFETVPRWHSEILQTVRDLQLQQLASRDRLDAHETFDAATS